MDFETEDRERLPRMSMTMLLLQKTYARQQWWADAVDAEIARRKPGDMSVALVSLRKTA